MLLEDTQLPPVPNSVLWQIVGFSLLMIVLSQFFNWKYRISPTNQMEFQQKVKTLQEDMKYAQAHGDQQMFAEVSSELQILMKELMQKQMAPNCLRSIVFIIILSIVGGIYNQYDYSAKIGGLTWFWFYVLLSLIGNMLVNKLRKKIKAARGIDEADTRDSLRVLQQNMMVNRGLMAPSSNLNSNSSNSQPKWKDQLNSSNLNTSDDTSTTKSSENISETETKKWKDKL